MKKNPKHLILIILVIISFIIIFLFINRKENKPSNPITYENNPNETIPNNQNEQLNENTKGENNMEEFTSKINIKINGTTYIATLEDNPTTREFIKKLPLEIKMEELNGNEKFYYFDESLPSNSTHINRINSGDLMLYGNNCLVLFYETFNTPYSYTRIGKIENPSSLKDNVGKGNITISFSK